MFKCATRQIQQASRSGAPISMAYNGPGHVGSGTLLTGITGGLAHGTGSHSPADLDEVSVPLAPTL